MSQPDNLLGQELHNALEMFIDLTGVDPSQTSFSVSFGGGMDDLTVKTMYETIAEALELDHSNVTGYFLLDALSTAYFEERNFSTDEMLENPTVAMNYISKAKAFRDLVRSPEIKDIGNTFSLNMRQALRHYQGDTDEVMELMKDHHKLAYLRRDALRSIERLRVDQFLKGEPEASGIAPAYLPTVHQFWNINSLVNAACHQKSGVTLNLVRDPNDFQSYFAFTIRNGGNLFVLSDVPVGAHPLQQYMSRRPDRDFSHRACRNWFPYDLLNIKYSEASERLYIDKSGQRGLIPMQQEFDPLKDIHELSPEEIIWTVMMFDLIVDKFWHKGFQSKELSYTAQMIREESPLIDEAVTANLPVTGYEPLSLPVLTVNDVKRETITEAAIGHDGGAPLHWMEARYVDQIADENINLLCAPNVKHYLPPAKKTTKSREHKNHSTALVSTNNVVSVMRQDDENLAFWHKEGRYGLHSMDSASFGTREEVDANRKFLARYNLAKSINKLADEEYNAREKEIRAWWKKAIHNNIQLIYSMAANEEYWREVNKEHFNQARTFGTSCKDSFKFMQRYDLKDYKDRIHLISSFGALYLSGDDKDSYRCHFNNAKVSFHAIFTPQTADDLAFLAGCTVIELPDVLQHWVKNTEHKGNQILQRIDPMAWATNNPWANMPFDITLCLSKSGLNKIEKLYPKVDTRPTGKIQSVIRI